VVRETVDWSRTTRFAGPEDSPGFLLWQVSSAWRRAIEQALAPLGLTHPQFVALACLGWLTRDGAPVVQATLGRQMRTDPNTVSQILRGLEARGLVTRERGVDDRTRRPKLTADGARMVAEAVPRVEAVDASFFGDEDVVPLLRRLLPP
jgi:DNA-binding MarR family transcriptional regulator